MLDITKSYLKNQHDIDVIHYWVDSLTTNKHVTPTILK